MKLKKLFGNKIIEFYCHPDLEGIIAEPVPSFKKMPEWYRKLPKLMSKEDEDSRDHTGAIGFTAKKCMPLIDCMSAGYIIPLAAGVHITSNSDSSIIVPTNPPSLRLIEFHNPNQVGGSAFPGFPAPPLKFLNYWVIKTAPGYSTLFMPPMNHFNNNFTCLSGLVDTDKYPKEVNFPAVWHANNFDDYIPAGTPLVQVIPIKRSESRDSKAPIRKMTDREFKDINKISKLQELRRSHYTDELREPRK